MRRSTVTNMLLLCGLSAATAAFATTGTSPQATDNSMTMNNMMSNTTMSNDVMDDPMPGNDTVPPAPMPTPPGTTTNELTPKPM